jgi:hypothetical protein
MKIPDALLDGSQILNILGYTYTTHQVEALRDYCDADAQSDMFRQRLRFDPATTRDRMAEAFLHEIGEVINNKLGLNLDHDRQLGPFCVGLFQVLTTNKLNFGDET